MFSNPFSMLICISKSLGGGGHIKFQLNWDTREHFRPEDHGILVVSVIAISSKVVYEWTKN